MQMNQYMMVILGFVLLFLVLKQFGVVDEIIESPCQLKKRLFQQKMEKQEDKSMNYLSEHMQKTLAHQHDVQYYQYEV